MKNVFLNHYFAGIFKVIQGNNNEDYEKEMNEIGKDIGKRLALLVNFKIEKDINSLIYRIVFEFLPMLYETNRKIEKVEELEKNTEEVLFLIYEQFPMFSAATNLEKDFCPSSLIAGIIEAILIIFDEKIFVVAYNKPSDGCNDRIIYIVKRAIAL